MNCENSNTRRPSSIRLRQHLEERLELARLENVARGRKLEQPRVAADLPQLEECVEHDDPAARQATALHLGAHAFVHREANRFVEIALRSAELDPRDDFGLLAAGRARRLPWCGALKTVAVAPPSARGAAYRRVFRSACERGARNCVRSPSKPGTANAKIDHSSSRWFSIGVPVSARRCAARKRAAACAPFDARILHELRLVEYDDLPLTLGQPIGIAVEQRIASSGNVVVFDAVETFGAVIPGERDDAQVRHEPRDLGAPVRQHAGRRDDQHRSAQASVRLFDRQMGQQLYRFTEAHVVGEHAAEAVRAQQPAATPRRELDTVAAHL